VRDRPLRLHTAGAGGMLPIHSGVDNASPKMPETRRSEGYRDSKLGLALFLWASCGWRPLTWSRPRSKAEYLSLQIDLHRASTRVKKVLAEILFGAVSP
jgi:hypothetical protein